MRRKKTERKLFSGAIGIRFYEDNMSFINHSLMNEKKTRSEVVRELIDDGIKYRKVKDNGFDSVAENYTRYLTATATNALRPLRKQLEKLTLTVRETDQMTNGNIASLVTASERVSERTRLIGSQIEGITETLSQMENQYAGATAFINEELKKDLAAIKTLAELSARNLIGIRVVVWLYLIEILEPLVKNYSKISRQQFTEIVRDHVSRLFTDVLEKLVLMKAGEVEEYIQLEVVNLYKGVRGTMDSA